jgi:predicted RNA binding protein YcfA (HicA-like mRNA interferase family)
MNYIKKLNELELEKRDEIYNIVSEVFGECEKTISTLYNLCLLCLQHDDKKIDLSRDEFEKVVKQINDKCSDLRTNLSKYTLKMSKLISSMVKQCAPYTNNKRELLILLNKRGTYMVFKYTSMIHTISNDLIGDFSKDLLGFLIEFRKDIKENTVSKIIDTIDNLPEGEKEIAYTTVENEKSSFKKIFNYRNMEKLAVDNNYNYKWTNGSHMIYEHDITNKIVVIPTHDLGLGLSIKIQKQIINNKLLC